MIKEKIKKGIRILCNPEKEYQNLGKTPFESALSDYLMLLLTVGLAAGIASFAFYIGKAMYLDLFLSADVQYLRLINYSFGRAASLVFFYLFAGTFLTFLVSVIIKPFFVRMKYTQLLHVIFYSMTPFLLFSWLPFLDRALGVWALFLFTIGIRSCNENKDIDKKSIKQRD